MDKLGKLDTVSVVSMGVVVAALVAGWIVTNADSQAESGRILSREDAVTLTQDGRMSLTVSAPREASARVLVRQPVAAVRGDARNS
jgi:hypothetical protein